MTRQRNTFGPLVCYHGCTRNVADAVLANRCHLRPSKNKWDWLGSGVYLWVDSWARAVDWAINGKHIDQPYVIGAYVYPGLCLNLTDYDVVDQLQEASLMFKEYCDSNAIELPKNKDFFQRNLDCAVLEFLHGLRADRGLPAYDTILGAFEEGNAVFDGSHFKDKTHLQLLVREGREDCIIGYFVVPGIDEKIDALKGRR